MSGRVPEDERTLRLGSAFENYQAEAREIDHRAMYECDHSFVIPRGDGYLCKDCDTMFDDHPADTISSVGAPVLEPEPEIIEAGSPMIFASGVMTKQLNINLPVGQATSASFNMPHVSGSYEVDVSFNKPLNQALYPKVIADEIS